MSELFQTYTETGTPLDLVPRDIVHKEGLWHRASNVFLFRSDKRLIVQRRSENKTVCPGAWDLSVAEHLIPGETYLEAAQRGLKEELSAHDISLKPLGNEMRCVFEDQEQGVKDYEFQQCFYGVSDQEIAIDEAEVSAIDFYDLSNFQEAIDKTPDLFTPWFIQAVKHVELFKSKL